MDMEKFCEIELRQTGHDAFDFRMDGVLVGRVKTSATLELVAGGEPITGIDSEDVVRKFVSEMIRRRFGRDLTVLEIEIP
jgi:hypothetical protein